MKAVCIPFPSLPLCEEDAALHQRAVTGSNSDDGDSSLTAPQPMALCTDLRKWKARTILSNCKLHFSSHLVLPVLHDIFPKYKPTKQGL